MIVQVVSVEDPEDEDGMKGGIFCYSLCCRARQLCCYLHWGLCSFRDAFFFDLNKHIRENVTECLRVCVVVAVFNVFSS